MIFAVDPGVRATGIVAYYQPDDGSNGCVEDSWTLRYKGGADTQDELADMCRSVCGLVNDRLRMLGYDPYRDTLVIEGFEYLAGTFHASSIKTALLVGAMMREFPEAVWQTSAEVLNPHRKNNHRHIKDDPGLVENGDLCTNEHERSALAHAIHFADGERQVSLF